MHLFKEPRAYMIKRRAKKSLHTKPVKDKNQSETEGWSPMTKARRRKRVHVGKRKRARVALGKAKPGHIVAHSRQRRKGEILWHNHVLHTAATANGVHGFHWFTALPSKVADVGAADADPAPQNDGAPSKGI